MLRERDGLVDGNTPLSRLLFRTRRFFVRQRCIKNLADAALRLWRSWLIGAALLFWRFARASSGTVASELFWPPDCGCASASRKL